MNRFALAVVLLASGCAPQTIGDLSRPALLVIVTEPGGFCATTHAVDTDGAVWRQASCEEPSGLVRRDVVVSADEHASLSARMDAVLALPDDADCDSPSPSGRRYRFVRTTPDTDAWPEVRQCDPAVPLPALELAAELERLTSPPLPTDGGP